MPVLPVCNIPIPHPQHLRTGYTELTLSLKQILEQRQLKELATLDSDFQNEKQFKIDQALSDLKAQYETEKENLASKHNMEMQEFVSSYKENDSDNKKAELLSNQRMELSSLEQKFLKECNQLEASITAELEAKHANVKINTRERHYQVSPTSNLILII